MGEQPSAKSYGVSNGIANYMSSNMLVFTCLGSVALGVFIGAVVKSLDTLQQVEELYLMFPIDILSHMIKAVTIPLIASSVVLGIRTFKTAPSKTIAMYTGIYFFSTTIIAVIIGLTLIWALQSGFKNPNPDDQNFFSIDTFLVLYRNIFPDSMMRSFVKHYRLNKKKTDNSDITANATAIENTTDGQPDTPGDYHYGVDILGLLFISFMSGLAFNEMEESRVIVRLICTISQITDDFFQLIRNYLPVGILFMAIYQVIQTSDWEIALHLMKFIGMVLIGLFLHGAIVLPLIYFVLTQSNPFTVIYGVLPALRTAFLLSSSAATMPVTLHCCKNNNIHNKVTRFMLPIGTNINMNGTALYQAAAAVFIALLHNIYLDFNLLFSIGVAAAAFSFISKGVPASGALTSLFILNATALPLSSAWILVIVEWILDHPATLVNVLGDCIGIALVQELSTDELIAASLHQRRAKAQDWQAAVEEYEEVQTHWNAYTSAS
ncbi:excitatory amino acid transporter 3-like [Poeciliopsis prolifica]|uniref:excitatory amino acid transporter 3-like n=1 Tax=Poeciliopsis prolifica TaxID=188132 RepID=UPI0024136764|nr:excitatory amino acid transporter 3-like [Poeciliopsis prolifica]